MSNKIQRCMKLLALVPWLEGQGTATFKELSQRFNYKPKDLLRDLMTLQMVGIPPYDPGNLIFIYFKPEDEVYETYEKGKSPKGSWEVSMGDERTFAFPPRLAPQEALILITAYSTIKSLGLEISAPLQSAMKKLRDSLTVGDASISVGFSSQEANVKFLDELSNAIENKEQVEIFYHSLSDAKLDYHTIEPWRLFFRNSGWYLDAYCHRTKAQRRFRVARIHEFKNIGIPASEPPQEWPEKGWTTTESLEVVLELERAGSWILDHFIPEKKEELEDGAVRATLEVSNQLVLERLLLQIGKSGKVIKGPKDLCSKAATKILKKYA